MDPTGTNMAKAGDVHSGGKLTGGVPSFMKPLRGSRKPLSTATVDAPLLRSTDLAYRVQDSPDYHRPYIKGIQLSRQFRGGKQGTAKRRDPLRCANVTRGSFESTVLRLSLIHI